MSDLKTFQRNWKFLAVTTVTTVLFYYLGAAHALIGFVYQGGGPEFLQSHLMSYKNEYPLSFYLTKADTFFCAIAIALFAHCLISAVLFRAKCFEGMRSWLFPLWACDFVLLSLDLASAHWSLFDMQREWAIRAVYEYAKEACATVILLVLFKEQKKPAYLALGSLWAFLFIDDAFQYHERAGRWLSAHFDFSFLTNVLHCKTQNLAEIFGLAPYFVVLLPVLWISYLRSDAERRRILTVTFSLIAVLFLFAVIVNFFGALLLLAPISDGLDTVENFISMLVMSILVSYFASKLGQA